MREIKSNPSKVVKVFVTDVKNTIMVITSTTKKEMKLTEIPIMDRYSNGSNIIKGKIKDSYLEEEIISKDDFKDLEYIEYKKPTQQKLNFDNLYKESLKQVDDKMVIINNFLDDVEDDKEIDK